MRHNQSFTRLLPLIIVIALLILAGVQAQPLLTPQLYLPLISDRSPSQSPTPTTQLTTTPGSTVTATATATVTATSAPPKVTVSGEVHLRPETAELEPGAPNPQRFVVVLDVSGSQNLNFHGQGSDDGQVRQCAPGPPGAPVSEYCGEAQYAWPVVEERRIYVQKQAAMRFIGQLNMPDNPGYDPNRPPDQAIIVAYNDQLVSTTPASFMHANASNSAVLQALVLQAGRIMDDNYLAEGGTHWAAGLYEAAQRLNDVTPLVEYNLTPYNYDERVIFVVDGVTNHFFNSVQPALSGGPSNQSTYLPGHLCYALGSNVIEDAPCQTTEIGGTFMNMDRPITQGVQLSRELLVNRPDRPITVSVIALGYFASTGLSDGVASTPAQFFAAQDLEFPAQNLSNVDQIFATIAAQAVPLECRAQVSASWVETVAEGNLPVDVGLPAGQLGTMTLIHTASSASYTAPILRNASTGALSFQLDQVPPGDYVLSAEVFYRGDDAVTRRYAGLRLEDTVVMDLAVTVGSNPVNLGPLALVLTEDVCAAPA